MMFAKNAIYDLSHRTTMYDFYISAAAVLTLHKNKTVKSMMNLQPQKNEAEVDRQSDRNS